MLISLYLLFLLRLSYCSAAPFLDFVDPLKVILRVLSSLADML